MLVDEPATFGKTEYEIDTLTRSLGFLTRVVHIQINDSVRAQSELPASLATLSMLSLVHANPGIRQVHAARILLIQQPNMAILVKNMVTRGLIKRRKDTGKRNGLWITAEGEEMMERAQRVDAANRNYADCLSEEEYAQLIMLLNRIYRARL
ncbi:MAG TPA: MarR family winged helix-turn-helix transcriptional regulator [Rhizorhapis sp.]|nr:MarR family winged helix-turn-helix transcriptional regulator [Rhizorhapis sp.]